MKEIYLISKVLSPHSIHVEDGIIKQAPIWCEQFINQSFTKLQEVLGKQKQKFIIEKVEDDNS